MLIDSLTIILVDIKFNKLVNHIKKKKNLIRFQILICDIQKHRLVVILSMVNIYLPKKKEKKKNTKKTNDKSQMLLEMKE